jgi:hypothetical protein
LRGIGEDYQLHWIYQTPPPDIPTAWINYFAQTDFQTYKAKFGWNLIRLGFYFSDVANNSNEIALDSTSLSLLDQVISICASNGLKVMLCDFNFTGIIGSDIPQWIQDWVNLATHYKGNPNIYAFQIGNEMENIDGNALTNLVNCTIAVRNVDSARTICYWMYSIPNYPRAPPNALPSNILIDGHLATYNSGGCQKNSQLIQQSNSLKTYGATYASGSIVGEINAQNSSCNAQTICLLSNLDLFNESYICWGYNSYRTVWDKVFEAI